MQTLLGSVISQMEKRTVQVTCLSKIYLAVKGYALGHHICSVAMCEAPLEAQDGALVGAQANSTLFERHDQLRDTLQASLIQRLDYDAGECGFATMIHGFKVVKF